MARYQRLATAKKRPAKHITAGKRKAGGSKQENELDTPSPGSGGDASESVDVGAAAAPRRRNSRANQNILSRYFKEMSHLDVLKPEEEFAAAKRIEELEVAVWKEICSYPALIEVIVPVASDHIEGVERQCESMIRIAKSQRSRMPVAARRQYLKRCESFGRCLRNADVDRVGQMAAIREVRRIARGESDRLSASGIQVKPSTKAFRTYLNRVTSQAAKAQRERNDFVKANLRLVVSIARRFNHGRMPLGDLIQEGNVGLIKAVERYDYRKGFRFSTYASWWIRHAISRALADKGRSVRIPVHMIDCHHKVTRVRRELIGKLGRHPTLEEVSEASEVSLDKVLLLDGSMSDQTVSLDREISAQDGRRFVDLLHDPDQELPVDRIAAHSLNGEVMKVLHDLKPIEADILRKRFGLVGEREQTLKEIGESYRLSRERIRQLQEQALGKIRRALTHRDSAPLR